MSSDAAQTDPKRKTPRTSRTKPFNLRYGNPGVITTKLASRRPLGGSHLRKVGLELGFVFSSSMRYLIPYHQGFDAGIKRGGVGGFSFLSTPKISGFVFFLFLLFFFFFFIFIFISIFLYFSTINGRNQAAEPLRRGSAAANLMRFGTGIHTP